MVATFGYCLKHGLLGVGWRVPGLAVTKDWDRYERAAVGHDSIQQPRYIHENVTPGDLVWTRDPNDYLGRITNGWEYWTTPEGQQMDIDIANVFRCDLREVPLDAVPGTVVSSFGNRGRTIQRIHNPSARAYSQYVWNSWGDQEVYALDRGAFLDIFAMLDPEETEDLVFVYLQSQGWYVIPHSRKGNTLRFEFTLTHSETGEKGLTQVKTGDVRLNAESYATDTQRIFLFQSNEYYDGKCPDNVTRVSRCELAGFLRKQAHLFPESFRTRLHLASAR